MEKIEYRVRPVTRFIVTRFHETDGGRTGGTETKGEYENYDVAHEVAHALCKHEHAELGWPLDDDRIRYPVRAQPAMASFGVIGGSQVDDFPLEGMRGGLAQASR